MWASGSFNDCISGRIFEIYRISLTISCLSDDFCDVGNYMFKVNNRNTRTVKYVQS